VTAVNSESSGKKRPLGRPVGRKGEQVKQQLLDAARQLFLSYEFKAVSLRQIAEIAGVNGAMVNYYFGSKKGLYLAMVDQVIGSLEQPINEMRQQKSKSVNDFVASYMQFLIANPWWPNFIIREVLFGEDEFRETIAAKFSQAFAQVLIQAVDHEVKAGNYRAGLRPELATWSLMGMMVFPFLSRPIAQSVLKSDINESNIEELIEHTCDLFNSGVASKQKESSHAD
jgi:AcrR family transcriptional regulator